MTSDCYAILGVTPAAEDVVIGAAYRALMRHYHPDTNPDPKAQARAQEISAAYAVLRDPAKRAEYDAGRGAGGILWDFEERVEPPPPMRTAGIATALLAVVLVGAVWAWPRPPAPERSDVAAVSKPIREKLPREEPPLRPESVRPPEVIAARESRAPSAAPPEPVEHRAEVQRPAAVPTGPVPVARAEPASAPTELAAVRAPPKVPTALPALIKPEAKAAASKPAANERVATLDRLSAGFFSQSMVHASGAKKELLLAVRDRSAAQRKACRSESCIADAYVRQMRETGAIMEGRAGPK